MAKRDRLGLRMILLAVLAMAWSELSARADWPHLRGPNYDGVAVVTGLAEAWPAEGPLRVWKRTLGQGHSGFIVAQGKLYTQWQSVAGQYLLCLDPDSGETVWEFRCDRAWQPKGAYPGPYASPTWYRGRVYYSSPTGLVGCVDASTGAARWSLNVVDTFQGKGCEFGYAATPLVEDDRVILPVGGESASLVALHAADGRTLWTAGSDPASYCPALPITFRGRRCVLGYLQNALVLVDSATGKLLHRQAWSTGYDEHSAWPLYREPHLLLTSPFRVPAACSELQSGPDDSLLCKPRWTSRELCNDVVSSVLHGNHVFGFDLQQLQASPHRPSRGVFKCLEWSTGKLCWSTNQVGHASLLVADGKLLLLNDQGKLILARADPAEYRELARTQVFEGETCWTPPTLWQGRLYLRSPEQAVCLYVGRPQHAPAATATEVAKPSWRFDTTWLYAFEREYPNDAPSWEEMTFWFAACVGTFAAAALVTALVLLLANRFFGRHPPGILVFLGCAFILGTFGLAFNALLDRYLFTWPAALYAAFHVTVWTCWQAEHHSNPRRARWRARLVMIGFLLVGYGYFELCKMMGMFVGWSFLFGFPAAFPLSWLAVRAEGKHQSNFLVAVWMLLAFSAYFWSCQGLLLWRAARV